MKIDAFLRGQHLCLFLFALGIGKFTVLIDLIVLVFLLPDSFKSHRVDDQHQRIIRKSIHAFFDHTFCLIADPGVYLLLGRLVEFERSGCCLILFSEQIQIFFVDLNIIILQIVLIDPDRICDIHKSAFFQFLAVFLRKTCQVLLGRAFCDQRCHLLVSFTLCSHCSHIKRKHQRSGRDHKVFVLVGFRIDRLFERLQGERIVSARHLLIIDLTLLGKLHRLTRSLRIISRLHGP